MTKAYNDIRIRKLPLKSMVTPKMVKAWKRNKKRHWWLKDTISKHGAPHYSKDRNGKPDNRALNAYAEWLRFRLSELETWLPLLDTSTN